MKCPHCEQKISLFSKEMNKMGKEKTCPKCQKPVRLYINLKTIAIWLIPVAILGTAVKYLLGSFGIIAYGITGGLLILLALDLKVNR